jgi:F0F1-type ATP synthase assembly protein I
VPATPPPSPTPDDPTTNLDDIERGQRELDSIHLPPVEPDDPRLAVPASLRAPDAPRTRPVPADKGSANQLMRISTVGTNFALAVAGLGLIGWAVQKWLLPSAAPWLLVGGLLLGLVVGALRFVHDAKALMK